MAKYDITYSCGHSDTIELCGPYKERYSKLEWLATQPCPECDAKARAEANAAMGFPQLKGSYKQIKWADSIRTKFWRGAQEMIESERKAASRRTMVIIAEWAKDCLTDAGTWIDESQIEPDVRRRMLYMARAHKKEMLDYAREHGLLGETKEGGSK